MVLLFFFVINELSAQRLYCISYHGDVFSLEIVDKEYFILCKDKVFQKGIIDVQEDNLILTDTIFFFDNLSPNDVMKPFIFYQDTLFFDNSGVIIGDDLWYKCVSDERGITR